MSDKTKSRLLALVCALVLAFCALLADPCVETGMMDEWSYIRSAQILAQTGHVVYNGWATAMIGWQLLWGALFFKLFGFSFLVARISILVVAVATVFILQRCMVRAGVNEWNATLGTLVVVCTPMMLPISLGFMTDIPGMFAIVVCLYACLRALQAKTDRAQMGWLCFAALGNAVGGTARQIAWLGVLVMVPCTIWLLRRKRRIVVVGGLSWLAGSSAVFAIMRWFKHQPYSVTEPLLRSVINKGIIYRLPGNILRPILEAALFLLPVSLIFLPVLWRGWRRSLATLGGLAALGFVAFEAVRHHDAGYGLLAPFLLLHGDYVTPFGVWMLWPMHCHHPVVMHLDVRVVLTLATVLSMMAVLATTLDWARSGGTKPLADGVLSWWTLCVLMIPFTGAYAVMMLPRGIVGLTVDKYLLPVLPVLLILLLRLYQECMGRRLPWPAFALVLLVGMYSVAATHDSFANYRGALAAIHEMRASGIPRTQIDGGWEYNAVTELDAGGFMHQGGTRPPEGVRLTFGETRNVCPIADLYETPDVFPEYSLAFNPNVCEGPAGFAPVTYHRWLSPHTITVYVVKNPVTTKIVDYGPAMKGGPVDLTCAWGCDATKPMPPH